jgi:hypothetical protein
MILLLSALVQSATAKRPGGQSGQWTQFGQCEQWTQWLREKYSLSPKDNASPISTFEDAHGK